MKRSFLFIIECMLALSVAAQVCPDWYESASRQMHYPTNLYYSAFVVGEQEAGETLDAAMNRLKNEARVEVASNIRTTVEKRMTNIVRSETTRSDGNYDEQITDLFESATRIEVSMEIPGLKTEAWQIPKSKNIAAFAFVSRKELQQKFAKQILTSLTKAEMLLDDAEEQNNKSEKVQAKNVLQKVPALFEQTEQAQRLLIAVDEQANEETLQLQQLRLLRKRYNTLLTDLKNGISIFISCDANLLGKTFPALKKELQGSLSDLGCHFVTDSNSADWVVTIEADAREYNTAQYGSVSQYTAIVDANIAIDKTATHQRIYEDELHQKGVHTLNYAEAARQAYKDITPQISTIIKQNILQ